MYVFPACASKWIREQLTAKLWTQQKNDMLTRVTTYYIIYFTEGLNEKDGNLMFNGLVSN
jgi:hypothetical protein